MLAPLEDPQAIRHADAELLSVALFDTRNHLLALLARREDEVSLRRAAQVGWFQEYWLARNVQRSRGEAAEPDAMRLASVNPAIEAWLSGSGPAPDAEGVRGYLAQTLETTLELLPRVPPTDAQLFFYRLALLHEDRVGNLLADTLGQGAPPSRAARDAVWLPAQRARIGSAPGGFVPENQRWQHEVAVPEFEIDAQPVRWAQFIEFAEDGGYDRQELWSGSGWAWLQAEGRRAPAGVEQLRGGVLAERGGALVRVPLEQAVTQVTRHEAEAWCRWAGRRLPTEPEWELAAANATGRGFVWGDVFEWVAGRARPWPGHAPLPGGLDPLPRHEAGVLRGASWRTRRRRHDAAARRFVVPTFDAAPSGFRSCSL